MTRCLIWYRVCLMLSFPWKIKLERRPRPLPPEFDSLCQMVAELSQVVDDVRKVTERTRQRVYREPGKDDHQDMTVDPAVLSTTAPAEDEWRTGDPAA